MKAIDGAMVSQSFLSVYWDAIRRYPYNIALVFWEAVHSIKAQINLHHMTPTG
jgi:hypothetical protein